MKTRLVAILLPLAFAGCASTTYEKRLVNGDSVKLSATSFLIKREIGKIEISGDKLESSKSDQAAVAQLLGEALLSKVKP